MKTFYFTATGNCLEVAKKIGGDPISIPQAIHDETKEYTDDAIGFVFPIFDGTVPKIIRDFVTSRRFRADYFFVIATYGFFPGNTLAAFQKLAADSGIRLDYSAELKMVDNYVPLFDIDKEISKLPEKGTAENLKRIQADITARKHELTKNTAVKNIGAFFESIMLAKTNGGLVAQRDCTVNDSCIRCGTCSRVCPAGNIKVTDKVIFSDKCYSCFACVHACPRNAIHVKGEKSEKRWRNPDVKLKELIDSNQQHR